MSRTKRERVKLINIYCAPNLYFNFIVLLVFKRSSKRRLYISSDYFVYYVNVPA